MIEPKLATILINVLGGSAVLGSYAYCLSVYPDPGEFWGGVPQGLRPLYTLNMLLAAAGYFAFSYFVLFRVPSRAVSDDGARIGVGTFNLLYLLILLPSALWMPLTFRMLESPGGGLWLGIRVVLFAVGIGSLGLLGALVAVRPGTPSVAYKLAIAGSLAFCSQTALLDALVWPAYFPFAP
jgi:hypothetical protein